MYYYYNNQQKSSLRHDGGLSVRELNPRRLFGKLSLSTIRLLTDRPNDNIKR